MVARDSLLVKVRLRTSADAARLRTAVHVRRRTSQPREGEYLSVHRGPSLDFDDLREYVIGDDVKDIDWKATARTGRPLVRRHVALRRHDVVIVAATSNTMAGLASPASVKRDVAVLAAGVLGQVAMRHGDAVGLVAGPVAPNGAAASGARGRGPGGIVHLPPRRGDAHLERVLRAIHDAIDVTGPPPAFDRLLADVTTVVRRRSILAVITDDVPLDATIERTLRRLTAQHEVLVVAVADADIAEPGLAGRTVRTVGAATRVPAFLRTGIALHDDLGAVAAERQTTTRKALARIGVASTVIRGGEDATLEAILGLLAQQRLFGARA